MLLFFFTYTFTCIITCTITVENTGDIKETDSDIRVLSPVLSTLLFAGIIPGEKNRSTVLSTVIFPVEVPILPYKRIKTINKESSHPPMREEPPSDKPKISRKKEGDAKPLVYPFTSDAFCPHGKCCVISEVEKETQLCFATFFRQTF